MTFQKMQIRYQDRNKNSPCKTWNSHPALFRPSKTSAEILSPDLITISRDELVEESSEENNENDQSSGKQNLRGKLKEQWSQPNEERQQQFPNK